MKISVIINTYNSAATLYRCLCSVSAFDEIILCDMHSTDNTIEIAKQFNCKIIMHEYTGIVEPARNYAISAATNEWVFIVDSDEIVPPQLKDYLYNYIQSNNIADALFVPRQNFFMGKFMHGFYPDYILRFMRKDKVSWPSYIHAIPKISGTVKKIPALKKYSFIHLTDGSISSLIKKLDIYTEKEAERRREEKNGILSLLGKSSFRFFKIFILKKGFLDGKAGLIYALYNCFYKILMIAKIWEKNNTNISK